MDPDLCLVEVLDGLMQPDGRGPATPGGEAAVAFLVDQLDAHGIAAPPAGRLQTFGLATRESGGGGWLTVYAPDGASLPDGAGWSSVPGSFSARLSDVRAVGSGPVRPIVGLGQRADASPRGWVLVGDGEGPADPFLPQIRFPEHAAIPEWFDLELPPRIVTTANVLAWLPGAGDRADEVVLLAAHHDHLPPLGARVYPGADDNASGAATVLCALRAFAADPPPERRSVLAVWFGGEEAGLWGSQAFVASPAVPLDRLAAVVVADMVGRLHGDALRVESASGAAWVELLGASAVRADLELAATQESRGSDDLSFTPLGIPTAHLFTGMHLDYHEPSDTADRLDRVGLERVSRFVAGALADLTTTDRLPAGAPIRDAGLRLGGVAADGAPILGAVIPGSPAARAGARPGDRVVGCPVSRVEPVAWLAGMPMEACAFAR